MRIHGRMLLVLDDQANSNTSRAGCKEASCCRALGDVAADDDVPIGYSPEVREWWLKLVDEDPGDETANWRDDTAAQCLAFCPFCGSELPSSLREEWFGLLRSSGIEDPLWSDELPEDFTSDRWWKERGL